MTAEFAGQVAVVTGGARGLGKAVCALLVERGASVYLVDKDGDEAHRTARELEAGSRPISAVEADVTDEASLRQLRARIEGAEGKLDVLVNNAGGWRYAAADEIEDADWNWTFDLNLKSVLLATRTLAPLMSRRRYGRIVNVASNDAYVAKEKLPHYAAAKAGVVSLTRSLGLQLAEHEILVNGVSPGAMATETAKAQGWLKERAAKIPLKRVAEPGDVAEVVLFLASSRNRFMVGETVIVNGGMHMV